MAHRDANSSGILEDQVRRFVLFHKRLSILDPSPLGHQPMTSTDGEVVLVLTGDIYNFRVLHAELEQFGHNFIGFSDTEVLLKLYLEHQSSSDDLSAMLQ